MYLASVSAENKMLRKIAKFLIVGGLGAILNVFLVWFFVDFLIISPFLAAILAIVLTQICKYGGYRLIGLFNKGIIKYLIAGNLFNILNIFGMWLLIDLLKLSSLIGATIVVSLLFILRFIFFDRIGLIKK